MWLGLIICLAMAGIDVMAGNRIFTNLVMIGPFVASLYVEPRRVAVVAAFATALAIALGWPNSIAATPEHLARVLLIAGAGGVAIWLATDRQRRERTLVEVSQVAKVAQEAIQRNIPAHMGDLSLATSYQSANSEALLGGDVFAAAQTQYGIRVVIGDVCGKGLDALRLTTAFQGAFRQAAFHEPLDGMVKSIEEALAAYLGPEDFITALFVDLRQDRHDAQITSCGHPEPFLLDTSGAHVVGLDPSPPLGLGATAQPETVRLAAGDRLLLYTDGMLEARDSKGQFFDLEAAVAGITGAPTLQAAIEGLADRLDQHAPRRQDDVAVLIMERLEAPVR